MDEASGKAEYEHFAAVMRLELFFSAELLAVHLTNSRVDLLFT